MFYIIEQGARIQTPVNRLLRSTGVNKPSATNPLRPVSTGDEDRDRVTPPGKLTPYQGSESAQQRSPVNYAHQIMTSPVITASFHQTVSAIRRLLSKRRFHHLPLVDDANTLRGIVSDRDLLRFAASPDRDMENYPVERLMTKKVISAAEQTDIRAIAEVMCEQAIGAVPIVNEQVAVVGIVSRTDILRTLVHRAPLDLWA